MRPGLLFVLGTLAILAALESTGTPAWSEEPRAAVNVADFAAADSPTAGIQEAIESLAASGGVITIPAGEYLLRRSIRVRSQVTLRGVSGKTVLRKIKQAGSRLAAPVAAEGRSVQVEDAAGFREGDEIAVFDQKTVGWLHAHAIVKGVRDKELLLDRRVGRAFEPAQGGAVINYFSAIAGVKVAGVVLEDLVIDGRRDENPGVSSVVPRGLELGFNFAAINLVDVTDSRIESCQIRGWPSDGISLQRGSGNLVTRCVVEQCRGEGYHPGGGLHDSEFRENLAHRNLANGFFFCARVERVTVRNNRFIANGRSGVGNLGQSGDTLNLVEGNLCEANGMCGIELLDGVANTVKDNVCRNNSQGTPGRWSGILLSATARSIVSGNRCLDTQPVKTQKHGIEERADCQENVFSANAAGGNQQSDLVQEGRNVPPDAKEVPR